MKLAVVTTGCCMTTNAVIVGPVLDVDPANHEEPLKFMVGRPFRPVLMMVGVFGVVYIPPGDATDASLFPSALEAIPLQFAFAGNPEVCSFHVDPELMLVYIPPPYTTAASFTPSELEAIEYQSFFGADVSFQVSPELMLV